MAKRTFFILVIFLLCVSSLIAQNGSGPTRNAIKVDLLGPPFIFLTKYPSVRWRSSVEYESFISPSVPISVVLDFELQARQYYFERYFSWPPNYLLDTEWWQAITTQYNWGTILGIRYTSKSVLTGKNRILCFVEPRIEFSMRSAKLLPNSISRPFLSVSQYAITPRLRGGFWYRLGANWAFEASLDGQKFKYIGDGHHEWGMVGEINVVFTI